jgi:hypothetical protein
MPSIVTDVLKRPSMYYDTAACVVFGQVKGFEDLHRTLWQM